MMTPEQKLARKEYLKRNRERINAWRRNYYYRTNKNEKNYAGSHDKRVRYRQELIKALGGKCVRCGISDWRCLQVDHICGGGNRERVSVGYNTWSWGKHVLEFIRLGENKFQALCANCNWIKRYENNELRWNLYSRKGGDHVTKAA